MGRKKKVEINEVQTTSDISKNKSNICKFDLDLNCNLAQQVLSICGVNVGLVQILSGFTIDKLEPEDYVLIFKDNIALYINTKTKMVRQYRKPNDAYNYVMLKLKEREM